MSEQRPSIQTCTVINPQTESKKVRNYLSSPKTVSTWRKQKMGQVLQRKPASDKILQLLKLLTRKERLKISRYLKAHCFCVHFALFPLFPLLWRCGTSVYSTTSGFPRTPLKSPQILWFTPWVYHMQELLHFPKCTLSVKFPWSAQSKSQLTQPQIRQERTSTTSAWHYAM